MSDVKQVPIEAHAGMVDITTADAKVDVKDTALETVMEDAEAGSKGRSRFSTSMILLALALSLFLAALDQTIVLVAIPTIALDLQSATGYTWVGGAYLLASAVAGPIWGKLSDIWGRKPILLILSVWFFISSTLCGTSKTMRALIIARAFQGTGGGGLMQLVFITISDLFSLKTRSLLFGLVEVIWAVAGGIGPLLGGVFAEKVSWRWCFFVNLPFSGVAMVLLFVFLDVHNPRTGLMKGLKAIDWVGSLSIIAVTIMILLGLDFGGETFAWDSVQVICLLVFGSAMIGVFLFGEKRVARYPLMPLRLFNNRHNAAVLVVTFVHGIVFMGVAYYLPLYTQSTKGASPLQAGVLMLPIELIEAASGIVCGILMHRFGCYRELIWVGSVLTTVGSGLLILLSADSSIGMLVGLQFVVGIGLGLLFQPVVVAIQVLIKQEDIATATTTSGFVRNIACSLGVVFGGVIFQNGMTSQASHLTNAGLPQDIVDRLSGADAAANVDIASTISDSVMRSAVTASFATSIQKIWIFFTCVAAVGMAASISVRRVELTSAHSETKTGLTEKEQATELMSTEQKAARSRMTHLE